MNFILSRIDYYENKNDNQIAFWLIISMFAVNFLQPSCCTYQLPR